jgi:hypothetical protein
MNEMIKPTSSPLLPLGAGPMNWIRGEIDRLFDDFTQPGRSIFSSVSPGVGPVPAMDLVDNFQGSRTRTSISSFPMGSSPSPVRNLRNPRPKTAAV